MRPFVSALAAAPLVEQKAIAQASATVAGGSFAGAWWATMHEVALSVLGVPLPVVLFAAFGSFLAGTYRPASGLLRAFGSSLCWMVVGIAGVQIAAWYWEISLAAKALPGMALMISGGLRIGLPIVIRKLPEWADMAAAKWLGRAPAAPIEKGYGDDTMKGGGRG
jgi:hypothetical protein